ncbi:NAD(P)/FAD-dependent oxidoreductase [Terrarubrum flagellatum]|uniref:NAD(P)/FAD-dependent oxidoreductase n=1 Tax=Terrirubrum flagellatum TaxID=2895980 RepID=UPI003145029A
MISRRGLLRTAPAALATSTLFAPALAQAKPRVVVIGGGPGGATAAKYIAKDSNGAIDVTLVEPLDRFVTCFHSNLFIGGFKSFDQITHGYDAMKGYGVTQAKTMATSIDRGAKTVKLADGSTLAYDRLVVSPGIDIRFNSVPGYSEEASATLPHGWKPGEQTLLVKKQLDALEDGALIVMVAPPNPYRCPPGPYERISMFAHVLKTKGHQRSKIIIVDPKTTFSKQDLFLDGWKTHYPGMVEWLEPKAHGGVKGVDAKAMTVTTGNAAYKAQMITVIPAQTAGQIAIAAALTNQTGYCAINPDNMQSVEDSNIYVLGDASIAGEMPKSAFAANSQAKVAAMMIRSELAAARSFPARYANTCWSLIDMNDAVKVGGRYEAKDGRIAAIESFISKVGEDAATRKQTYDENIGWYEAITSDVFG